MKRKSGKAMVDLDRKVTVIHLNVGSGYLTYIEEDAPDGSPKLKSVSIPKGED